MDIGFFLLSVAVVTLLMILGVKTEALWGPVVQRITSSHQQDSSR